MIVKLRLRWEQLGIEVVKLKYCGWARKGSFRLVVVIVNATISRIEDGAIDCVREQSGRERRALLCSKDRLR
jgi:hypothetical protein